MEQLSPQLMHKLVFTVLMHGLNDNQTPVAHKVLLEALGHPNPQVRELAVVALADLPVAPGKRVVALAVALADPVARVRRRAARALGDQGTAAVDALTQLVAGLTDPDPSVRRDCAGTCGRLGPAAAAAAERIVALLGEPETRTRAVVAVALKRLGTAAVPALLAGARSGDPELRGRCITLLAGIAPADPHVVAVLAEHATGESAERKAQADSALRHVVTPPPVAMPRPRGGLDLDAADALAGELLTD
jgi:HEAT repeat protein